MQERHGNASAVLSALENLRTQILDLSSRNRLLNFRHHRTDTLRIIDELPDSIYELLLSEEELRFRPVPEPERVHIKDLIILWLSNDQY